MEFWDIYERRWKLERLETGAAHGRNDDIHDHAGDWSDVKEESLTEICALPRSRHDNDTDTHRCGHTETRGDGVFDAVGGELWGSCSCALIW